VRARTPSIAAIGALGRPKGPRLAAKIDGDDASAAILESITGIGVTVADLIEGVAGALMIADPRFLTELVAERIGLIDFALRIKTGGRGEGRCDQSQHETGGEGQSRKLTHGGT